jgi:hypothetical protein
MSAEPGRKAPYSEDIRWRVVWQRIGMELTFREISKNLCLALGTAHNHFKVSSMLNRSLQGNFRSFLRVNPFL